MNLTSETLEQMLINMSNAIDEVGKRIASRPTHIVVPRKMLRKGMTIMRSQHLKFMMPFTQRKAIRRAKARQHASYITPRWAA
jgi:phage major head subunit gpT-like protein